MEDLLDETPLPNPDAARELVGGRLMVATPDDRLHDFVDEDGKPSEVGELIVSLADGTRTVREIAARVAEEFEVDRETAEADAAGFVRLLVESKVLVLRNAGSGRGRGSS